MKGDKRQYEARRERFYGKALSQAELLMLEEARDLEGPDEEIAMLRVRLFTAATERPATCPSSRTESTSWSAPWPRSTAYPRRRAATSPTT